MRALRSYDALEEPRPAAFVLGGRDFIHFHETPDGVVADLLLARGRVRMPVATDAEQAELLDRIEPELASRESQRANRKRRRR